MRGDGRLARRQSLNLAVFVHRGDQGLAAAVGYAGQSALRQHIDRGLAGFAHRQVQDVAVRREPDRGPGNGCAKGQDFRLAPKQRYVCLSRPNRGQAAIGTDSDFFRIR